MPVYSYVKCNTLSTVSEFELRHNDNDNDNVRQEKLTAELTSSTIKCNTIKYNKITRPTKIARIR